MNNSCLYRTEMKMNQLCLCFCLTAEALSYLKNIRESRNPVQLLTAASHLLYTYYIFNRISEIFLHLPDEKEK